MTTSWRALKATLWKNCLLTWKEWVWVLLEVLLPVVFIALLSYGRANNSNTIGEHSNPSTNDIESLISFFPHHSKWELWHAPSEEDHVRIINYVGSQLGLDERGLVNYETNEELLKDLKDYNGEMDIYAVMFDNNINPSLSYNITIRKRYLEWNTRELYRKKGAPTNYGYNPYLHEGFLALQILIDKAFIDLTFDGNPPNIKIAVQELPDPSDNAEAELQRFFLILTLLIMFSLGVPIFLSLQKQMWHDEGSGMNDLMIISGVKMWIIWLGWFLHRTVIVVITLMPIICCLKGDFWGSGQAPIKYCHWGVLFLFFLCYLMATISTYLCCIIFFNSTVVGYMIGLILWIMSYFVPTVIEYNPENISPIVKILLSILFENQALRFGCNIIATHESAESELDFSNFFSKNKHLGYIVLILVAKIIYQYVLSLIAVRISKIDRQTLFSYFNRTRNADSDEKDANVFLLEDFNNEEKHSFVSIRNLVKKYGVYTALDIRKLDLRLGDVTAILGTNGAGKSTLISIIAGIITSYSGSVAVNTSRIGLCPQANILFEYLTVRENVLFFAKLRTTDIEEEVTKIMEKLGLDHRKHDLACTLSTGMRRKLCLAMALVGDPEIIILDEPAGGMININDKTMKDLFQNRSRNTILITTHSSEVAEFLADNILIMNEGKILNQDISYSQLRSNDGNYISITVSDLSHLEEIQTQIKVNLADPTIRILHRIGKRLILHSTGDKETCSGHIGKLENFKQDWHIDKISYNDNIISNVLTKYLIDGDKRKPNEDTTPWLSNPKENELQQLFHQRDYNFVWKITIHKLFFLRKNFYWYFPGLLIMLLFVSLILLLSSEGRYYNSYNEPSIELNLDVYRNETISIKSVPSMWDKENNSTALYANASIADISITSTDNDRQLTLFIKYSSRNLHIAPVAVNLAMNLILNMSQANNLHYINTTNVPFVGDHTDYFMKELSNDKILLLWSILLPLGMLIWLADYVIFPHIENATHFLRFQTTSWMMLIYYWMGHFLTYIFQTCFYIALILAYVLFVNNVLCNDPLLGGPEFAKLYDILFYYVFFQFSCSYIVGLFKKIDQIYDIFILFGIASGLLPLLSYIYINAEDIFKPWMFIDYVIGSHLFEFGKKITENYNWDNMNPLVKSFVCHNPSAHRCCLADSAQCEMYRTYSDPFSSIVTHLSLFSMFLWRVLLWYLLSAHLQNSKQSKSMIPENTAATNSSMELKNVNFSKVNKEIVWTFHPNTLYGVLGANEAGKSLLLATLTKENMAFKGEINRLDSTGKKININDKHYIEQIGYFPGKNKLMYWITAKELLTMNGISRGYSITKSSKSADLLLEIFGLTNKKCVNYSGGQKKLLRICNAFMGFPDVVVIDDVVRSLDLPIKRRLFDFLLAYKKYPHKTIIVGLSREDNYSTLCDRFLLLEDNQTEQQPSFSYRITFRMKNADKQYSSSFKTQLLTCKNNIATTLKEGTVQCDSNRDRLFSISHSQQNLCDLFLKAEQLKIDYPAYIEDYSIIEV